MNLSPLKRNKPTSKDLQRCSWWQGSDSDPSLGLECSSISPEATWSNSSLVNSYLRYKGYIANNITDSIEAFATEPYRHEYHDKSKANYNKNWVIWDLR